MKGLMFRGYSVEDLRKTFSFIQNVNDVRGEIYTCISKAEIPVVSAAIEYVLDRKVVFTPTFLCPNIIIVESK